MARATSKINQNVVSLLCEKASHSPCTYRVSAIAFDAKGDVLGHATNSHSANWNVCLRDGVGRAGTGQHAERVLMRRYRNLVKTILICRIGRSGVMRPIDPCPTCRKVAAKYGVKIISICK